jgi:hypothetical protein
MAGAQGRAAERGAPADSAAENARLTVELAEARAHIARLRMSAGEDLNWPDGGATVTSHNVTVVSPPAGGLASSRCFECELWDSLGGDQPRVHGGGDGRRRAAHGAGSGAGHGGPEGG